MLPALCSCCDYMESLPGQGVTPLTLSQAFGGYLEICGAHPHSKAINLGTKQTFNLKLEYTLRNSDLDVLHVYICFDIHISDISNTEM